MSHLDLVKLTPLMELTSGNPEIIVGLIDGPVAISHPDLASENIREIPGKQSGACSQASSFACLHGTFVAGILSAKRNSTAPAICPDCTLLVHPIFAEITNVNGEVPSATPEELASAIVGCIEAGARIINLSVALTQLTLKNQHELDESLNYAAKRGVIVVAASGNQGTIGSSVITRHPWVIPVVACDLQGRPISQSNFGSSIGRHGLRAPGYNVTSTGSVKKTLTLGGTSVAAPFVTGTIALLLSEFPSATAIDVMSAVAQNHNLMRAAIVPPLLDAWAAYQAMTGFYSK